MAILINGDLMRNIPKYVIVFFSGALCYGMLELFVRGRTHWTMLITGGIAMIFLMLINQSKQIDIVIRALIGAFLITSFEFCVGSVVNVSLGMNIWSYSGIPMNVLGQICPKYSALWFILCIPAFCLCDAVEMLVSSKRYSSLFR